mgnify:FL=1
MYAHAYQYSLLAEIMKLTKKSVWIDWAIDDLARLQFTCFWKLFADIPTCDPGYNFIPHLNPYINYRSMTGVCVSQLHTEQVLLEEAWSNCQSEGAVLLTSIREIETAWLTTDVWLGIQRTAYGKYTDISKYVLT